jgi:putative N6-adenine-specific DNA methylase
MQQVYEEVNKVAWEEILVADGYFSVHSFSDHPDVENTMFLNLRVKDAIADRV